MLASMKSQKMLLLTSFKSAKHFDQHFSIGCVLDGTFYCIDGFLKDVDESQNCQSEKIFDVEIRFDARVLMQVWEKCSRTSLKTQDM